MLTEEHEHSDVTMDKVFLSDGDRGFRTVPSLIIRDKVVDLGSQFNTLKKARELLNDLLL